MNKKLLIAIVVIVLAIIGVFLVMTYHKGSSDNTTGAATKVPNENANGTVTETGADSSKFSEITEEMSKADVVDLIGEPTDKQTITTPKGNVIEYWYYTDSSDQVWQIGFDSIGVSVVRKY